jgi:hypothetical protein
LTSYGIAEHRAKFQQPGLSTFMNKHAIDLLISIDVIDSLIVKSRDGHL